MFLSSIHLFLFSIVISIFLLTGCNSPSNLQSNQITPPSSQPISLQTNEKSMQKQGIQGQVLQRVGNQMPNLDNAQKNNTPQAVQTTVWIFADVIPAQSPQLKISDIQGKLNVLKQVKTDRNGKFFAELPPGEYTVLAQFGDNLYLNSFTGDGNYKTVKVNANQTSEIKLVNTDKATF